MVQGARREGEERKREREKVSKREKEEEGGERPRLKRKENGWRKTGEGMGMAHEGKNGRRRRRRNGPGPGRKAQAHGTGGGGARARGRMDGMEWEPVGNETTPRRCARGFLPAESREKETEGGSAPPRGPGPPGGRAPEEIAKERRDWKASARRDETTEASGASMKGDGRERVWGSAHGSGTS